MTIAKSALCLDFAALDLLMPMHLLITGSGHIGRVAPTIAKLRPGTDFCGQRFLEVFELRRPRRNVMNVNDLRELTGVRLRLKFRAGQRTTLRGILVRVPGTDDLLLNLSFGFSVIEAVQDYALSNADFAPTDLAVELLYLVEAKTAVMKESRNLNAHLQEARLAAETQAVTDALTGLHNRRAMDQHLTRMIGGGGGFCLMHLDLDYFKDVNDTLGHAAGDHVLQIVAKVLVSQIRENDTVARVGGDDFVLLFDRLVDEKRLTSIADRIIRTLEEPIMFQGRLCRISGSIGFTISKFYDHPDPDRMLLDADVALYASKHLGRARNHGHADAFGRGRTIAVVGTVRCAKTGGAVLNSGDDDGLHFTAFAHSWMPTRRDMFGLDRTTLEGSIFPSRDMGDGPPIIV